MFTLVEHALRFQKWSRKDKSAKCDALFTGNPEDVVIGALFEIPRAEKRPLDKAEGLGFGYDEKRVTVTDALGNSVDAFTYCATSTDPSLLPHSWYVNHVIVGAKETGVPADYLDAIAARPGQSARTALGHGGTEIQPCLRTGNAPPESPRGSPGLTARRCRCRGARHKRDPSTVGYRSPPSSAAPFCA